MQTARYFGWALVGWIVLGCSGTGSGDSDGLGGAVGATGPPGEDGSTGPAGPAGPEGALGAMGDSGADGAAGMTGPAGADGATGDPGGDGAAGATGPPGDPGGDGAAGATGPPGDPGGDGAPGPEGAPGDGCELTDDGEGTVTLTCGDDSISWPKALCDGQPYDPGLTACVCGNGIREGGEFCDDGDAPGGGCSATCDAYLQTFDDGEHDLYTSSSSSAADWYVSADEAVSAPNSLRFADPNTGINDGSSMEGMVQLPAFIMPEGGAVFSFSLLKLTSGYSSETVTFSVADADDNVTWFPVIYQELPEFTDYAVEIDLPAGETFRIRIAFATYYSYGYPFPGIFLDELSVGPKRCGDGVLDTSGGELCDDGDNEDDDGCPADCQWLACPDAVPGATRSALAPDEDSCLGFFETGLSWSLAEGACVTAGGHLVTIDSAEQNAMVAFFIGSATSAHIGAGDLAVEGTFTWTSGTPWSFTAWAPGEPNNIGNEDCTHTTPQGRWNDLACAASLPFVCEVQLP